MKVLQFDKATLRSKEDCIAHFETTTKDDYAVSMLFHVLCCGNTVVIEERDLKTKVSTIRKSPQLKKIFTEKFFNLLPISLVDDEDKKRPFPIFDKYGHKNFKDSDRKQITVLEELGIQAVKDERHARTGDANLTEADYPLFCDILDAYLNAKAEAAKKVKEEKAATDKATVEKALEQFVKAHRLNALPEAKQKEEFKLAQKKVDLIAKATESLKELAEMTNEERFIKAYDESATYLEELVCYAEGRMLTTQEQAYSREQLEAMA